MPSLRAELQQIRTFPELICFLRDEMGWPIESDDFDDLYYDYAPEELGIDPRSAAKIVAISRLRPLVADQPWGIFFVEFEPKRLPVVALRRILSGVVLRRRASANKADRMAWETDDLLFVSNYGEGDERQISFAHFSEDERGGLPTLKVLGWDNLDTLLHLDAVAEALTEHLAWPSEGTTPQAWREDWRSAFTLRYRETITTSRGLSIRLAELARAIRDRIKAALDIETEDGPLTKFMGAFRRALVHDLDARGFADMYAQTIAYGLLSARIADPDSSITEDLAANMRTNPLLKGLMETFVQAGGRRGTSGGPTIDFDELGVGEVVDLLDDSKRTNIDAVIRDFGDRNPQEDPVIHFYELFLREYDPKEKLQRGVFFTPRPVVSYIVRSVDELLRNEFGLVDGFADTTTWGEMAQRHEGLAIPDGVAPEQAFVQVLDPATGTGTFLVEIIDVIHETLVAKWTAQGHDLATVEVLWNDYVPEHLLPRLHGYELLMAPYAIAHLKIGLKLHETAYRFSSPRRLQVYLTNALESAQDFSGQLDFAVPALAHEAQEVSVVKRTRRFTVVVGNPPYSKISANLQPEHRRMVDPYRYIDGEKVIERGALALEMNLQDDYVKFLRLAQRTVLDSHAGVVAFVTNHGFISTPTLRGMRWSLLSDFGSLTLLDLHGHSGKREVAPDGSQDENVFDIQQGVAVSLLVRTGTGSPRGEVKYADLYGTRALKYSTLLSSSMAKTKWADVHPAAPNFVFRPSTGSHDYFASWLSLHDSLRLSSDGIVTARDGLVVAFTKNELLERIIAFSTTPGTPSEVCGAFGIPEKSAGFNAEAVLAALREESDLERHVMRIQYRPFDYRYLFYFRGLIQSMRWPVTSQLDIVDNLVLLATRQVNRPYYEHAFVSRCMVEKKTVSHDRNTQVYPILVKPKDVGALFAGGVTANWTSKFSRAWEAAAQEPLDNLEAVVAPLEYVYAILHSPTYRCQYFEFLRSEYPRIPMANSPDLIHQLRNLGRELLGLHVMESPRLSRSIASYAGPQNAQVARVNWSNDTVWLDAISKKADPSCARGFHGVPEAVWRFRIGGYQVCEKWLKDRKGRILSEDDIAHYQKIVVALAETIRLMQEIDEVIEAHGGWPGAFQTAAAVVSPS
jgi:predicted helicase